MYETYLTAVGTLVTAVDKHRFTDGTTKVNFRIACNERRFDRASDDWTNGDSLFLRVSCWRNLADNVHASFVVGDPIMVRGRLVTREWEKDGRRHSVTELDASAVGPDLARSVARITRTKRGAGGPAGSTGEGVSSADPSWSGGTDGSDGPREDAAVRGGAAAYVDERVAVEGDPWQGGSAAVEAARRDVEPGDDGWPDDAAVPGQGGGIEAAVGS